MRKTVTSILGLLFLTSSQIALSQAIIIDHNCTDLDLIPATAIEKAKSSLQIAYGHTSHGSQLITGMNGLIGQTDLTGYKGDIYNWNEGGTDGALDIDDYFGSGDLGHTGDTTWAPFTRTYLADNPDVNVIIYSWCGGCSDNTIGGIQTYLDKMNELEQNFPGVKFVYMTGHRDIGNDANLKASNKQIRDYCIANDKILYDFGDIESYNPDGTYFEFASDDCSYYDDENGTTELGNWATEWCDIHTEGVDWYNCSPAHSVALNGNLKGYAAWWLWCRLAGWEDIVGIEDTPVFDQKSFTIYPNPVIESFRIKESNITSLSVINTVGKVVKNVDNYTAGTEINLSEFPKGIYFVRAVTDKGIAIKKILLK